MVLWRSRKGRCEFATKTLSLKDYFLKKHKKADKIKLIGFTFIKICGKLQKLQYFRFHSVIFSL